MGALRWLLALALWLPVAPDEVFSMELEKDGGILRLEVPKTSDAAAVGAGSPLQRLDSVQIDPLPRVYSFEAMTSRSL